MRAGQLSALPSLRAYLRELLVDPDPEAAADALLVVTELVGNAYRHAMPPWDVRLELVADRTRLRVEVDDGWPVMPTVWPASRHRPKQPSGLLLVDQLARHWGCWPTEHGGKTVWAEIALRR